MSDETDRSTFRSRAVRVAQEAEPYLFWTLLAVATYLSIRPFWVSVIPPFDDLGGHVAMADAWARLESVELYQQIYERRTGLVPNTIFARLAGWLHPLVEPMVSLRLYLSLVVMSTVGAMYACTRVFRRSPWVLFLALPFIWNGSMYYGMVNYIPTFPLFFGGIALAAKTGETGDWRWGAGLGVLGLFSFFVHGLGVLFVVGASVFILVLSVRRWAYLGWLGVFAPTVGLWVRWRGMVEGRGAPSAGIYELLMEHGRWFGPMKTLEYIVQRGIDIVQSNHDLWCFAVLVTVWLIWMGVSESASAGCGEGRGPTDEQEGWWGGLRKTTSSIWAQFRRHRWLLLVVCLWGAVVLFPAYIKMTDIKMRLIGPFFWSAALLPRLPRRNVIAGGATVVAVCASMWFAQFMTGKVQRFQTQELEPLVELIEQVPEQSRVQCIRVYRHDKDWLFRALPLGHNCAGLVHVRRSGFGGFHFPGTAFNPIKFKEGVDFQSIGRGKWRQLGRLQRWDYAIVRGDRSTLTSDVAELVATAGGKKENGVEVTRWRLYRVKTFENPDAVGKNFGGDGGGKFRWRCPEGTLLSGLSGGIRRQQTLGRVTPHCRAPGSRDDTKPRRPTTGPSVGSSTGGGMFDARCPEGTFVVGLSGRAGAYVDQLNTMCAPLRRTEGGGLEWNRSRLETMEGMGGEGGDKFEWTCPPDTIATGIEGRHGGWIDAIGVVCEPIERLELSSMSEMTTQRDGARDE